MSKSRKITFYTKFTSVQESSLNSLTSKTEFLANPCEALIGPKSENYGKQIGIPPLKLNNILRVTIFRIIIFRIILIRIITARKYNYVNLVPELTILSM